MRECRLTDAEAKLADIIWANVPIESPRLIKLCEAKLGWKKSTTYTMLKRLEGKEIFQNRDGTVYSLISKEELFAEQSKQFVSETFDGSLPRFLTAFTRGKRLSDKEIDELQRLITEHKER